MSLAIVVTVGLVLTDWCSQDDSQCFKKDCVLFLDLSQQSIPDLSGPKVLSPLKDISGNCLFFYEVTTKLSQVCDSKHIL